MRVGLAPFAHDPRSLLAGIKREPGWVTLETLLMRSKTGSVRRMTYKTPVR